eukprot:CAMPEP_0185600508 /NCGR_PEP_ID=MMETSP0436-20130131/467_1 /TAXON_ID=626734 ORGANISM="Favella taraikaensis, Strain Fe Narragansett Bay" /NCGR_SAMPLE_ID=MMETSP0436 /ASSEMBLY_ACC=CAM_ASM_000390 /LENGTH=194 /DNA_ID=CAMNT_0028230231 /DNA_START=247 /DNA_END=828 /DNA_ORIENTATION=-
MDRLPALRAVRVVVRAVQLGPAEVIDAACDDSVQLLVIHSIDNDVVFRGNVLVANAASLPQCDPRAAIRLSPASALLREGSVQIAAPTRVHAEGDDADDSQDADDAGQGDEEDPDGGHPTGLLPRASQHRLLLRVIHTATFLAFRQFVEVEKEACAPHHTQQTQEKAEGVEVDNSSQDDLRKSQNDTDDDTNSA